MIFGLLAFIVIGVLIIVVTIVLKRQMRDKNKRKLEKNKKKLKQMVTNGIHESINNGSVPLLTMTFFDL